MAFAAILLSSSVVNALSIEEVGGPSETPPADFSGDQFVDSRGCVFMRAGLDGQTAWVPRIDRNRQVICDRPPTLAAAPAAVGTASEVPAKPPVAEPAAADAPQAAVRRVTRIAPVQEAVPARRIGCFADAPAPLRVRLAQGGTAVLCTRGDGTLDGVRVPLYPPGEGPTPALGAPGQLIAVTRTTGAAGGLPAEPTATTEASAGRAAVSPHYVQVGAFRVPGNAIRAREALRQMGLPTARAETQGLTMVFAGPFATPDEALLVRGTVRGAGFDDAFIR
jgi:hypothetical protein